MHRVYTITDRQMSDYVAMV